jgi:hypothetical protein
VGVVAKIRRAVIAGRKPLEAGEQSLPGAVAGDPWEERSMFKWEKIRPCGWRLAAILGVGLLADSCAYRGSERAAVLLTTTYTLWDTGKAP